MPRNGLGVYSKPAGTTAVTGTTIESAKYNSVVDDIIDDLNAARPVVAGGTGGTTALTAREGIGLTKGADLASASTVDLSTATGTVVDITGTTTITDLGTVAAGQMFILQFDGALTFGATGITSISTAAGDIVVVVSEGSGSWRLVSHRPATNVTTVSVGGAATYTVTIPTWANTVHIGLDNISFSSSGIPRIQLADAGGTETSGYACGGAIIGGSNFTSTTGLELTAATTSAFMAKIILQRRNATTWIMNSNATFPGSGASVVSNATKATSEATTGFVLMNSAGVNFSASGAMVATFYP